MKKIVSILLFALLAFSMVSCGGTAKNSEAESTAAESSAQLPSSVASASAPESIGIDVDKGPLTVTVTFPAKTIDFLFNMGFGTGEKSVEEYVEEMKGNDKIEDAVINPDGSVSLVMTKATHEKILNEQKKSLDGIIGQFTDGTLATSIKKIEYTGDMSVFDVTADKAAYEGSFDSMVGLTLGASGMFYRLFDGDQPQTVTINVIDEATGDIFSTAVYPDDFEN